MRSSSLLLATFAGVATCLPTVQAQAFICMRVSTNVGIDVACPPSNPEDLGPSLSWMIRTIPYTFHVDGTGDLPGDTELDVIRASFAPWADASSGGVQSGLVFQEAATRSSTDLIGFNFLTPDDNENLIIFRDLVWPRPGQATSVIGLTTTSFNSQTGEIIDADIEFNAANFNFGDLPACCEGTCPESCYQSSPPSCCTGTCPAMCSGRADLANTAVHEIGHMLGMAHSQSDVRAATMFAQAIDGEIHKRDLDPDDAAGIVFKYPNGQENGYCLPTRGCGCCAEPIPPTSIPTVTATPSTGTGCSATAVHGWLVPLLLALLIVAFRRTLSRH